MMRSKRIHTFVTALLVALLWGCAVEPGDAVAEPNKSSANDKSSSVDKHKKHPANRLARETSPYLLLHAHNPVDWFPWGPEAFEKAKAESKPIFVSIGYSSCYWCHVMERNVFSNEEIARYMNENFVNIKVDREERPDVDDIYMTALQIYFQLIRSSQGGGWPLSMFLTPAGKPIAGGTYFPPHTEKGRTGFDEVTKRIVELWTDKRDVVNQNADLLTQAVRRQMKPPAILKAVKLERKLATSVSQALLDSFDAKHGGVDFNLHRPNSPKFPVPAKLALLQYEIRKHNNQQAAKVVYFTLDRIATGGIRDHLAGGFHRYSTDRYWLVPHFEKMLYDQAQLADVYIEAYRQTNRPMYREVAEGVLDFLLEKMTDPRGGFHSALDAETDGVEGSFYVWQADEIDSILSADNAALFKRVYGFGEPNRFEHGYVLHLPRTIEQVAKQMKTEPTALAERLDLMRKKLLVARRKRKPLLQDDKILTSWNGLAIRALAHAGTVLKRGDYIDAGKKAARFILAEMRDEKGRLHRTYRNKQAKLNAYLDDYAFLVDALLALHLATGEDEWLKHARQLTDEQIELFWDKEAKAFFFTAHHHEELLARTKNANDTVLPAGNSISVRNLVRLAELTGEKKYQRYARETLDVFASKIKEYPRGMTQMALALNAYLDAGADAESTDVKKPGNATPDGAKPNKDKPKNQSTESRLDSSVFQASGVILRSAAKQPFPRANKSSNAKKKKKKRRNRHKIEARAILSVDKLTAGGTCQILLLIDIDGGWHINTNPAVPKNVIPTTLSVKSKHGIQLKNVKYPAGKKLKIRGRKELQHVYNRRVQIRGELFVPANVRAKTVDMELSIHYQACNERVCKRPRKFRLSGKVPIVQPGETAKKINQKHFAKSRKKNRKI